MSNGQDAAVGVTTESVHIDDLSLEQLVQLSQGLGRQRDKIDQQMRYLRNVIAERLACGERESVNATRAAREAALKAAGGTVDAAAPGAVIESKTA